MAKKDLVLQRRLKFGIEIEVIVGNYTREQIAQAIRNKGVEAYEEGYNHTTRNYWKVITDSSCGYEVVSPVLYGIEGLNELQKVCEALNEVGCEVDIRCGLHVHHDINDLNLEQIKNIYRIYHKHAEAIEQILPKSRRLGARGYAKPLDNWMMHLIEQAQLISALQYNLTDRYWALNFTSYTKYGTIEFRQHSGTIDFDKMKNWVLLTHKIVERATSGKKVREKSQSRLEKCNNPKDGYIHRAYDLYTELNINGTEVADFYKKRSRDFRIKEGGMWKKGQ